MNKRDFLRLSGAAGAGFLVSPLLSCTRHVAIQDTGVEDKKQNSPVRVFELPPLGFSFDALEPHIDALTMEIHHGKHHGGYVKKLNEALTGSPLYGGMDLPQIFSLIGAEDTAIRNNGGGHYNHSLFWKLLEPGGSPSPGGPLLEAILAEFGSADKFIEAFRQAATNRFGSGWAWLSLGKDKRLFVSSTPNQDNPLMARLAERPGTPILGIDVWEHAYYLNYQNRRADYIAAFLEIINWDRVAANYSAALIG